MSERYQIVSSSGSVAVAPPPESNALAEMLVKDRQLILPLLDLVEQAQCAIDDLVDVMVRATIEAVLQMSAEQLAGPRQQGKKSDRDVVYHGSQSGPVKLQERQLKVTKPRLRKKPRSEGESGEVELPAYAAMHDDARLAARMLHILMRGVSTRNYAKVLPDMAETVGVSKSQVSREFIEAGERLPNFQVSWGQLPRSASANRRCPAAIINCRSRRITNGSVLRARTHIVCRQRAAGRSMTDNWHVSTEAGQKGLQENTQPPSRPTRVRIRVPATECCCCPTCRCWHRPASSAWRDSSPESIRA